MRCRRSSRRAEEATPIPEPDRPEPDPRRFLRDLEAKPASLRALAGSIDDVRPADLDRRSTRVITGMGSSRYAGSVFSWLPAVSRVLAEGTATFMIAPACESGDWLHVDLYLTKPLDYRALVFAGSRFTW